MAHQLTQREDGTTEFYSGENKQSWHKLGQVVAGLATAREAIQHAKLDWKVEKRQIFFETETQKIELPDNKAIVRADNNVPLGIVKNRYHPIQNVDSFDFFDEIVGGGQAVYDTAGSLFEGRKVFITAKLPKQLFLKSDKADKYDNWILLYTSHDGSHALTLQCVSTRVVCNNTLSAALNGATNCISIRHTKNYEGKVHEAQKTLGIIHGYYDNLQGVIDSLDSKKVTKDKAVKLIEELFPTPEGDSEASTRMQNQREQVLELFLNGKGNCGKTRLDLLNGVTEFNSHHRSTRITEGKNEEELKFVANLMGSGAILNQKAMDLLTK